MRRCCGTLFCVSQISTNPPLAVGQSRQSLQEPHHTISRTTLLPISTPGEFILRQSSVLIPRIHELGALYASWLPFHRARISPESSELYQNVWLGEYVRVRAWAITPRIAHSVSMLSTSETPESGRRRGPYLHQDLHLLDHSLLTVPNSSAS